jgi:dolichol-phosphate mannosyltransferase
LKISNWEKYSAGIVPIIVGGLFMFGLIFIFLGLIGEYIASIQLFVKKRPMVVEQERINF